MNAWWLLTLSGVLGSAHCVGMCGGFAALIGLNTGTLLRNLRAQFVYSAGRLASYMTLGAVAGFAGKRMIAAVPSLINVPAILCFFSGLFLVREGMIGLGIWPWAIKGQSVTGCLLGSFFKTFLRTPGLRNAFSAGILTGFLPCGLVYAFVSLAGSSGDLLVGMATMAAFGLGTIPLMVATGVSASLVTWTMRQRMMKLSSMAVIATGLLTLGRGTAFLQMSKDSPAGACPFCAAKSVEETQTPRVHVAKPDTFTKTTSDEPSTD